jgi:hypothetical protein
MFDLTTSSDFYAMLVEDFDDFMAEPHSARRALHCAITAYHLREWVWRDWLESNLEVQKVIGVCDEASFNAWVNQSCVWFLTIRDLANGTKHFRRDQGFETMRVTASPFALDQHTAGFDEGAWGSPISYIDSSIGMGPHQKGYLLIDYGEGAGEHRWKPAAHLLEIVVRFWRDFFRMYRSMPNLPASKHHVD